jgi:hypothetical protein
MNIDGGPDHFIALTVSIGGNLVGQFRWAGSTIVNTSAQSRHAAHDCFDPSVQALLIGSRGVKRIWGRNKDMESRERRIFNAARVDCELSRRMGLTRIETSTAIKADHCRNA